MTSMPDQPSGVDIIYRNLTTDENPKLKFGKSGVELLKFH